METKEVLPENISGAIERLDLAVNEVRKSGDKAKHLRRVFERMDDRPECELLEKTMQKEAQGIPNIVDMINELSTKIIMENMVISESLDYLHIKLK